MQCSVLQLLKQDNHALCFVCMCFCFFFFFGCFLFNSLWYNLQLQLNDVNLSICRQIQIFLIPVTSQHYAETGLHPLFLNPQNGTPAFSVGQAHNLGVISTCLFLSHFTSSHNQLAGQIQNFLLLLHTFSALICQFYPNYYSNLISDLYAPLHIILISQIDLFKPQSSHVTAST